MYRKGSILVRQDISDPSPSASSIAQRTVEVSIATTETTEEGRPPRRGKKPRPYEGMTGQVVVVHEDIIGDAFWSQRPWILA